MSEKQIDLDAMRAMADGARRWDRAGFLEIKKFTDALDDLTTEIEQLRKERDTLRAALTRITAEHCAYKLDSNSQYDIGVVDGHRCAASLARAALAAQGDKPHD